MADPIKKETEFIIKTGFCDRCGAHRYFYQNKSGGSWFCQLCGDNERGEHETVEKH